MLRRYQLLVFLLFIVAPAGIDAMVVQAQPLRLILPTSNKALLDGDFEHFYQYTDRTFQGVRSRPWEGGQYGYVRNQKDTEGGIVFTRFHEGLDIRPLYRDRDGEPLDTVRSVDAGYVVYVNDVASASSYGKYVVVEHFWSGMPFYSLYAHLGSTRVRVGDSVRQGQTLGRLGYTGRGIDKRRAHVHFEINLLLNESFGRWHDAYFRGRNRHGLYNGVNLAGLDVAALYLEMQADPELTIERFMRRQSPFFRVRVPNEGALDLHFRYPWLSEGGYDPAAPSLEIAFSRSGLPLRIETSEESVADPVVVWAEPVNAGYAYFTSGVLTGSYAPALANSGRRYLHLLTTNSRVPPAGMDLAGRQLPPRKAVPPPAPVTARPAADVRLTATPRVQRGKNEDAAASAAGEVDAESAGGEVRGW